MKALRRPIKNASKGQGLRYLYLGALGRKVGRAYVKQIWKARRPMQSARVHTIIFRSQCVEDWESLSGEILNNITDGIDSFIRSGDKCDQLLQMFHRFDEGLSLEGKWQGGTVTGVCRGWGTSKVRTSMYEITRDFNGQVKLTSTWLPCSFCLSKLFIK